MKNNRKIVHFRKPFHLNIGVILFGIVVLYLLLYVGVYVSRQHISVYEVEKGHISQNITYTGLALRDEQVYYADSDGQVTYYTGNNEKVRYNSLICSIDQEGSLTERIENTGITLDSVDKSDFSQIYDIMYQYASNNTELSFYDVYQFKDDIQVSVQEAMNTAALQSLSEEGSLSSDTGDYSMVYAARDGLVNYYIDGFESVSLDNFETGLFDPSEYSLTNLRSSETVAASDPLYKVIGSEAWYMLVPVNDSVVSALNLEETSVLLVTFKKDNDQAWANTELRTYGEDTYLLLTFNNSMIRYASDRYLAIEFQTDTTSGLKIPKSAIVEKEFYVLPKKYFLQGDNSSDMGVMKITKSMGKTSAEFISTELYYETDEAYYVMEDELSLGDTLQMPDGSNTIKITNTAALQGVYNVNKGYAVFKQISVLAESNEYAIVDTNTSYGISLYDHIALDGTAIAEGDMLN